MNIAFFLQNLKLSPETKEYIEKKLQKFSRFSQKIMNVQVDLSFNPGHDSLKKFRAEINLELPKALIHAAARAPELRDAFDLVEEKIQKQLLRWKETDEIKRRETRKIIRQRKSL